MAQVTPLLWVRLPRPVLWLAGAALLVGLSQLITDSYYNYLLRLTALNLMVVLSLNLLMGYAGQAFIAAAAIFAVGAYCSAILVTKAGLPFLAAWVLGGVLAAATGVLLGLSALRLAGAYLAMVSIGFNVVLERIMIHWSDMTGGPEGITGIPGVTLAGWELDNQAMAGFVVICVLAMAYLVWAVVHSQWGRAFMAIRESELAARSLGIASYRLKAVVFFVTSLMAGLAGGLYSHTIQYISPDIGSVFQSFIIVIMVLLGGMGTMFGPFVGATLLTIGPQFLSDFQRFHLFVLGWILLIAVVLMPNGVLGLTIRRGKAASPPGGGDIDEPDPLAGKALAGITAQSPAPRPAVRARTLEISEIHKNFGGIQALASVSLTVEPGTIHGLIGPNGSGKSTLVNVITGIYRLDHGRVRVGDRDITGWPTDRIARLGLIRSFQAPHLFRRLSVRDNLCAAQFPHTAPSLASALLGLPGSGDANRRSAAAALDMARAFGLEGVWQRRAADLSQGHQRRLEIARAMLARPGILVLDEPAAGLTRADMEALCAVLIHLKDSGLSILLIEHHMDVILRVCDRITVLDRGRVIAEDCPAGIQADPAVQQAYLGTAGGRAAKAAP